MAFVSLRRLAGAAFACAAALALRRLRRGRAAAGPHGRHGQGASAGAAAGPRRWAIANGVPVIEYGSLTCPHCAAFSKDTLPQLKKDYIDTGKVHFIFREFSRNPLDVAAFVLARCLGDDKALAADELLFAEQDKWAFVDKPLEPLIAAMRPTGMTQDQATSLPQGPEARRRDRRDRQARQRRDQGHGTPTFVIDGKVYGGELTFDQLKAILDPLVKK